MQQEGHSITPEAEHTAPLLPVSSGVTAPLFQVQPILLWEEPQGPSQAHSSPHCRCPFPALSLPSPPEADQTSKARGPVAWSQHSGPAPHLLLLGVIHQIFSHPSSHSRSDSTLLADSTIGSTMNNSKRGQAEGANIHKITSKSAFVFNNNKKRNLWQE